MITVTSYASKSRTFLLKEERPDADREKLLQGVIDGEVIEVAGTRYQITGGNAPHGTANIEVLVQDVGAIPVIDDYC